MLRLRDVPTPRVRCGSSNPSAPSWRGGAYTPSPGGMNPVQAVQSGAKKKKLLRLANAEFLAGQTLDLSKLQLQLRELKIDDSNWR